jgi:putative ABC transport system permease protein
MRPGFLKLVSRSVLFYKKPVFYQLLIIGLLSAVITGSLLTGGSVRSSLRRSSYEHLGNTGILISSGFRYFDPALAVRLRDSALINCTGLLELKGYSQNLATQKEEFNTRIYGVDSGFFAFNNNPVTIRPGEAALNEKLATTLGLKTGDQIIIRYNTISDIPSDAPFAPEKDNGTSLVLKVGPILTAGETGNFSLSISQIVPMNIFVNLSGLTRENDKPVYINRLLIDYRSDLPAEKVNEILKRYLRPSDIGLKIAEVRKTGEYELRSSRIFIDKALSGEISKLLPSSAPLITYLANRFTAGSLSTPYSFVSALPSSLYPGIVSGNDMIINSWLARDLSVNPGDSLEMYWYSPDSLNRLVEKSSRFRIRRVVDMEGIWGDSTLMPDFPGISGRSSCSDWDAGVPVNLDKIRKKDEEYWNRFRGTPKAFIGYDKGIEIWGNNFGPATAIRFPAGLTENEINARLNGSLDPDKTGFIITGLRGESVRAANQGVDFSTLFLSLGFFLILAAIVLLSFAAGSYFDSKKAQINTFHALGFKTGWIERLLLTESAFVAFIGSGAGAFAGILFNKIIIHSLNTVWKGAVQTDTLSSSFSFGPVLSGFLITLIISLTFIAYKIWSYMKDLYRKGKVIPSPPSARRNFFLLMASFLTSAILFVLSLILKDEEILLCFISGSVLLVFMILYWRQYFIGPADRRVEITGSAGRLSDLFYSFYPSHAVNPILFVAAGIFAVFITGVNRMDAGSSYSSRSGGTGGYLLWCETSIPVREDLSTAPGRKSLGLDEQLAGLTFVQMKRSAGDDASCLNLNHIIVPRLLGVDPTEFISRGSFSFAKSIAGDGIKDPWQFLNISPGPNTIYGIADQTVLEWGLKIKPGDTLTLRSENGQPLHIIIAAGLKSSVFQGYVLTGIDYFRKFYPSVSGSSVFLAGGNRNQTGLYKTVLDERLASYGIHTELTTDRLASFYEVTNTYLSVFGILGALGMITGIAGLGFVLLRNYSFRKREFALMLATGFSVKRIRRMILSGQMLILSAGIISGIIPAVIATIPSLRSNPDLPWLYLALMISAIFLTGSAALFISVRSVTGESLTASLRKE